MYFILLPSSTLKICFDVAIIALHIGSYLKLLNTIFLANLIQLGTSEMEGLVENTDAFMVSFKPDITFLRFQSSSVRNVIHVDMVSKSVDIFIPFKCNVRILKCM